MLFEDYTDCGGVQFRRWNFIWGCGGICMRLRLHLFILSLRGPYTRKIYTEEKANVVAAVWGTELVHFLAALAVFH